MLNKQWMEGSHFINTWDKLNYSQFIFPFFLSTKLLKWSLDGFFLSRQSKCRRHNEVNPFIIRLNISFIGQFSHFLLTSFPFAFILVKKNFGMKLFLHFHFLFSYFSVIIVINCTSVSVSVWMKRWWTLFFDESRKIKGIFMHFKLHD